MKQMQRKELKLLSIVTPSMTRLKSSSQVFMKRITRYGTALLRNI